VLRESAVGEAERQRDWRPPFPLNVRLAMSVHGHGYGDPTFRADRGGALWRTSLTPDGPATMRITQRAGAVSAAAWGPGADWLLDSLPALLGADDDPAAFLPGREARRHCQPGPRPADWPEPAPA